MGGICPQGGGGTWISDNTGITGIYCLSRVCCIYITIICNSEILKNFVYIIVLCFLYGKNIGYELFCNLYYVLAKQIFAESRF